ncbi:solute carrier organic anion transporter family member 2A1-like [Liolophura sinensis]|uniref:solute carrier organic anion transporter family member 2A1-like n=1 Tax=Liolophura sinensis TaxID=3198878 RepID=UPI003158963C
MSADKAKGTSVEEMATHVEDGSPHEDDVDTRCGVGSFKPSFLQVFATIQGFVAFNALSNLFTYGIRIFLVSQLTTIEKRFGFSSSQSGFILSSSQISFVVCILLFSYYSRYSHIPRILSVTNMIAGATGIVFFTAHFLPFQDDSTGASGSLLVGNRSANASAGGICQITDGPGVMAEPICNKRNSIISENNLALGIFLACMLIQGAVTSPRTPLGGTFVDDNNPVPTNTGKYIGIMMGILTLAPALAFAFGAMSSRIFHTLEATDLTSRDPTWIGAWWIGFVILGCLSMFFSSFLFCFPKRLRMAPVHSAKTGEKETKKEESKMPERKSCVGRFKRLVIVPLRSVFRVLRLPVFTLLALSSTMHTFALLGMASFFPKYLETQFYIPTYKTSLMLGVISLFGSTIGPVVGGFVTSHFKLTTRGNLRLILGVCILLTIGCPIGMFLAGQPTDLVQSKFGGQLKPGALMGNDSCVAGCLCSGDVIQPVCGSDGVTYMSPCHAGCYRRENSIYLNCTCSGGTAKPGSCAPEDVKVYPLLVYSTLTSFTVTFAISPNFMVIVRTVTKNDKSLALGLSSFISTLIGHFPAPVVYGAIVDSVCSIWHETCAGTGACAHYDLSAFRFKIFGTNMGLFFLSAVLIFFALLAHNPQDEESDSMSKSIATSVTTVSANGEPELLNVKPTGKETKY